MAQALFAAGIRAFLGTVSAANDFAASWGERIEWMGLLDGLEKAKKDKRFVVVVVAKERCAACNQLKKCFRESRDLHKMSNNFVMIKVAADEVSSNIKYKPDGNYVPRVFFLDPEGRLLKDMVRDPSVKKWKYNYATEKQLLDNMLKLVKEEPEQFF